MSRRRVPWIALNVAAGLSALLGLAFFWTHLQTDAWVDVHAYYNAAARLNAGLPLYPSGADTNAADFYRYPPLFAIAFRPLALLPYDAAVALWEGVVVAAFVATLRVVGIRRRETWLAVGFLGLPIAFTLSVGQAQAVVTLLLAVGTPFGIALAANIKLFPVLAGAWFVGRRDWRRLGSLVVWLAALAVLQLLLEPRGTEDFVQTLGLGWVGQVQNLSPYAVSPTLWAILFVAGTALTIRLAPTRWGWAAAAALATLAPPRLPMYLLMGLLAGLRPDRMRPAAGHDTDGHRVSSWTAMASLGEEHNGPPA